MISKPRQQGVAILTVLLIIALVVVIATSMTDRLQYQLRRSQMLISLDQGLWINIGAEQFAEAVLNQDFADSPDKVHLEQYWASGEQVYPLDGGTLTGKIVDKQACFNVNGLAAQTANTTTNTDNNNRQRRQQDVNRPLPTRQLQGLLEAKEIDSYQAEKIADALTDWVDKNNVPTGSMGAEDSTYISKSEPYLPANSPIVDIGELPAVSGVTAGVMAKVSQAICALPGETTITVNVNTVKDPAVFAGLFAPDMTIDMAQNLIENRPSSGYDSVADFLAEPALQRVTVSENVKSELAVTSSWFEVRAETNWGGITLRSRSLLHKEGDKQWTVVRRQLGGPDE